MAALVLACGLLPPLRPARADDAIVQPPCDESAFDGVLAAVQGSGGGTITFGCGSQPTVIFFTGQKSITTPTTIHGGRTVTLSGGNTTRLFLVLQGSLGLSDITLSNGFVADRDGGAVYNDRGTTLVLDNVTVRGSQSGLSGGGIVSYGPLVITNSLFENNRALNGGALYVRHSGSTTDVRGTIFRGNQAFSADGFTNGWGGAILVWDGATLTAEDDEFADNSARSGGAIYNTPNSMVTVTGGIIHDNTAGENMSGQTGGGAIYNAGESIVNGVTARDNTARFGGGLRNEGTMFVSVSTITGNVSLSSASATGGGILNTAGTATLDRVTINGNRARLGAGIANTGGTLTVIDTTITANEVTDKSEGLGGGIYARDGEVNLLFVTIAGNTAPDGLGLAETGTAGFTLRNVILDNAGPTFSHTCSKGSTAPPIVSLGFNIATESDSDCGLTQLTDRTDVDPLLSELGDFGGPTQTMLPAADSPAIDTGLCLASIPADQRGVMRPQGAACDIGAVERRADETTSTTVTSTTTSTSISTTTSTSMSISTTTTLAGSLPGGALFPEGRRLVVKQRRSGAQRLKIVLLGSDVAAPNPCTADGELIIEAHGAGAAARTFALGAAQWKPLKAKRPERGCSYTSGPVVESARIKSGKKVVLRAAGDDLGIPLDTDPRPVRVALRHGEHRHCVEFGGQGTYKPGRKLIATDAPGGGTCPDGP